MTRVISSMVRRSESLRGLKSAISSRFSFICSSELIPLRITIIPSRSLAKRRARPAAFDSLSLSSGESYDDYYLKFEKTENCSVPRPITETGLIDSEDRTAFLDGTDTLPLSHDLFKEDAVILYRLQSREVSLLSKNSGRGVKLSFEDFPYLILWSTNNNGPFIALEPWSGLSTCENESDVFEEKQGVSIVKPGETRSRSFEIEII